MNILISEGRVLITDFGISKQLDATSDTPSTGAKGIPAYLEPQCFIQCEEREFEINKKSDIYSLGVLFWELTSGIPPFNKLRDVAIILKIIQNIREEIIANTPLGYSNLYKKCWSTEPDQRPFSDEVLVELDKLSSENTAEFITNNINGCNKSMPNTSIYPTDLVSSTDSSQEFIMDNSSHINSIQDNESDQINVEQKNTECMYLK